MKIPFASEYPCCPADQEEGHKDSCPNEGANPPIYCGESIPKKVLDNVEQER
jgi:hypothetical protein